MTRSHTFSATAAALGAALASVLALSAHAATAGTVTAAALEPRAGLPISSVVGHFAGSKATGVCSVPTPVVSFAPAALDFGTVQRGVMSSLPFTLTNSGTGTLQVLGIRVPGSCGGGTAPAGAAKAFTGECTPFNYVPDTCPAPPFSIAPGESCSAFVQFDGTYANAGESGTVPIEFDTNAAGSPTSFPASAAVAPSPLTIVQAVAGEINLGAASAGTGGNTLFLTLRNDGAQALELTSLSVFPSGTFNLVGGDCPPGDVLVALAPGASCRLDLNFTAPPTLGVYTGSLYVNLTIAGGFSNESYLVRGISADSTGMIAVEPASLYLGSARAGESIPPAGFRVWSTNINTSLPIDSITVTSPFQKVSDGCSGASLPAGGSCQFGVGVNTTGQTGSLNGLATIVHRNAGGQSVNTSVSVSADISPDGPLLVASSYQVDFGANYEGKASSRIVTLTNTGNLPTAVLSFTPPSPPPTPPLLLPEFEVVDASNGCLVTLAPLQSCTFEVRYNRLVPTGSTVYASTEIAYGGLYPEYVSLSGATVTAPPATLEMAPKSLAFPATPRASTSAPLEISLGNTGMFDLPIGSIIVTTGDFAVTNNCPTTVVPGACCLFTVTFTPTATGQRSASLTVTSGNSVVTIPLSGVGEAVLPPTVSKAFSPATARVGEVTRLTVSITNPNAFTLNGLSFTDTFPSGLVVASAPDLTNTCGGTATAAAGGGSLALARGTLLGNGTGSNACTVSVSVVPTVPGTLDNSLPAGAVTSAETTAASVSTAAVGSSLVVSGAQALPTAITFTPGTVFPGVASKFDLSVTNPNLANFSNSTFTYTLPAGLAIANPANAAIVGASCGGAFAAAAPGASSFTVTGLVVPTAGACNIQVNVSAAATGSYAATIAANAITGFVLSAPTGNAAPAITPVTLTVTPAPAPVLSVVPVPPGPLEFGAVTVNTQSAPQAVAISNTGNAPLTFTGPVAFTGPFAQGSTTCGSTLPAPPDPLSACSVQVVFKPLAVGPVTGSLSVASNGGNANLNLTGEGTPVPVPAITVSPAGLSFPAQIVGTTSPAQTITVSSSGTAPLAISNVAVTGDYGITSPCTTSSPLPPQSSCAIDVTFKPVIVGTRTGAVTIASNDPGSPSTVVALTGAGTPPPEPNATLSPATLAFAPLQEGWVSAPLTATLTNKGGAPLVISAIQIVGTGFRVTDNCGGSVASLASCTLSVVFAPAGSGNFAAELLVLSNAPGNPARLLLTGTGTPKPLGRLSATPGSLSFGDQILGTTSAPQTLTVTNTGNAMASVSRTAVAGDFGIEGSCYDLPPGGSCGLRVTFTPGDEGLRAGSITFESDAVNPTLVVTLAGRGAPLPVPRMELSASTVVAGATLFGNTETRTVTVRNTGGADLVFGPTSVTGNFSLGNRCTGTLPPGGSCAIDVTFVPGLLGRQSGCVNIPTNVLGSGSGECAVRLSGTGCMFLASYSYVGLVCTPTGRP